MDYAGCPYNATHIVPVPEFALHEAACPDKALALQLQGSPIVTALTESSQAEPL